MGPLLLSIRGGAIGYHATHVSNLFGVLKAGGFTNKSSGDEVAGICTAPKFWATRYYNYGAVLECEVHGFQGVIGKKAKQQQFAAFAAWAGEFVPIGMNLRQREKGTKLGQLLSHPNCLCIKKIYIDMQKYDAVPSQQRGFPRGSIS